MKSKKCAKCKKDLLASNYAPTQFNVKSGWCRPCLRIYKNFYYFKNKTYIQKYKRNYYLNNKEKTIKRISKNSKIRKEKEPAYHLKLNISKQINFFLKKRGKSKGGNALLKYVGWNLKELEEHIEKLFSHPDNLTSDGYAWMNWNNYGLYKINEWDDNDVSTWRWQLDHIIPHAAFNYLTMEDEDFKRCWALSNLRPYSAKQNNHDSNRGLEKKRFKNE